MSLIPAFETAAQKALRIPEIVAMIAEELHGGELGRTREPRLKSFILVNRLWFNSGVHLLWRSQLYWAYLNLDDSLLKIHPSRRPFYAAFIQNASINTGQTDNTLPMQLFRHIDFPVLKKLHINVMNPHCTQLPLLGKHNIRTVRVQIGAVFNCKARIIREVIEQCLESFPGLQELWFRYPPPDRTNGRTVESGKKIVKMLENAGFEKVLGQKKHYHLLWFRRITS